MRKGQVYFTSLDVVDINACFKEFFKDEIIEGFTCEKCKRKGTHTRTVRVYKAPNILVLHLKRFEFLKYSGRKEKIESKVQTRINNFSIPKEYCCEPSNNIFLVSMRFMYFSGPLYNLSGIVNHYGTTNGGHYIAYDLFRDISSQ